MLSFGCSSSSGGGSGEAAIKELYSVWERSDGEYTINFDGGANGIFSTSIIFSNSMICSATGLMHKTSESEGTFEIRASFFENYGVGSDPGCASLNGMGTYTYEPPNLTLCYSGSECQTYK